MPTICKMDGATLGVPWWWSTRLNSARDALPGAQEALAKNRHIYLQGAQPDRTIRLQPN